MEVYAIITPREVDKLEKQFLLGHVEVDVPRILKEENQTIELLMSNPNIKHDGRIIVFGDQIKIHCNIK